MVLTGFGRLSLVERIAKRLPQPAPVIELDVQDPDQLASLAERVGEHVDTLDGVVHSIAFAPQEALGGSFLDTTFEDVSTAVHVSAYSLKSLTMAALPLMPDGGSVVGLNFDAQVAWPGYDWMGVAKAGLEATARYLAKYLGERKIRVNLVSAGPVKTMAARSIPGFDQFEGVWDRRPLGLGPVRTRSRPRAEWSGCSPTGSPRPPARSCTSTVASTRWVPDRDPGASGRNAPVRRYGGAGPLVRRAHRPRASGRPDPPAVCPGGGGGGHDRRRPALATVPAGRAGRQVAATVVHHDVDRTGRAGPSGPAARPAWDRSVQPGHRRDGAGPGEPRRSRPTISLTSGPTRSFGTPSTSGVRCSARTGGGASSASPSAGSARSPISRSPRRVSRPCT